MRDWSCWHTHTDRDTDTHRHGHIHTQTFLYSLLVQKGRFTHVGCSIFSCFCDYSVVTKKYLFMLAGFSGMDNPSQQKQPKIFNLIKPAHKYDHKFGDIYFYTSISQSLIIQGATKKNRGCPRHTLLSSSCNVNELKLEIKHIVGCTLCLQRHTDELHVKRTQPMERSHISMVELC